MDTDVSHAVEERLAAIEARLDALDGGASQESDDEVEEEDEEPAPAPAPTSSKRGRKSQATTIEEPIEDTTTVSEWSST